MRSLIMDELAGIDSLSGPVVIGKTFGPSYQAGHLGQVHGTISDNPDASLPGNIYQLMSEACGLY